MTGSPKGKTTLDGVPLWTTPDFVKSPTKHYTSKAKRKVLRKIQQASRRTNRGLSKGQKRSYKAKQ